MADDDYGKFQQEHLDKIQKGLNFFNQGMYWECHEELEDHWMDDSQDNARYVYWAIIQAATSIYHVERDSSIGAYGQIRKAKDKINKCESLGVESELLFDSINWVEFKDLIKGLPVEGELKELEVIGAFRFKLLNKNGEK